MVPPFRIRIVAVFLIVGAYIASFYLPAVRMGAGPENEAPGWLVFVIGGAFGWANAQFGWFANLAVPTGIGFLLIGEPIKRWLALSLAVTFGLLAIDAAAWSEWPMDNGSAFVEAHEIGFYLWIAAVSASIISIAIMARRRSWNSYLNYDGTP